MKTGEMLTEATNKARHLQGRVTETARQATETTDRYVHENPWMIVGLAAVVGCVIGFLLRPRD